MFSQYVLILVWVGVMAFIANSGGFQRIEIVCGKAEYRYPWLFAFIVFVPVIWMAGHRGYVGDTYAYRFSFQNMLGTLEGLPVYMASISKDKGFYIFSYLIKVIIGNKDSLYLLIVAAIQGVILLSVFRKYSYDYMISVFLFLASSDYISWMYNGIRQFMAVMIAFAATTLMIRKKYVSLLIVILLASSFHQSALLMIPFVFIAQGEAWNKKTLFFIFGVLLAVIFVGQFTGLLDDTLSMTQYSNVVSDYTSSNDDGTNPLRVMVYSVPAILSFFGRKQIRESGNQLVNFCANMSIVSMGLYVISMATSGIFIGRIPIYVSLYSYILLPWEIENLFSESTKKIVHMGMIVGYLLFYYYQMRIVYRMF